MAEARWTPLLVEERMVEAAEILRRLPETRARGYVTSSLPIVREYWEAFGWQEAVLRRPAPSPASIDRMDAALEWLAWLEPTDARIVWLRASGERWKTVCWKSGLARSAAHQHWVYALCVIALKLNGQRVPRNRSRQHVVAVARAPA